MTERKNITAPADWWEEFQHAADEAGKDLSTWLREAGRAKLPKEARKVLSKPQGVGRPKGGGK